MPTTTRFVEWVDLVAELSRSARGVFPRAPLAGLLTESFEGHVSWNWVEADGSFGFEWRGDIPGFPDPDASRRWASEGMRTHPLVRWFALTHDPAPISLGRVPRSVAPAAGWGLLEEMLAPYGLEQQLSIPHRFDSARHHAFVISRAERDFDDDDLDLARRVQPLLALLDRQVEVLAPLAPPSTDTGLTGRELAVLRLLGEGLTATAMAHRLLVSPRTVHTHLRSIYRKLGVGDRMRAVLLAGELGLLREERAAGGAGVHPEGLPARWTSPDPCPDLSHWPVRPVAGVRGGAGSLAGAAS